MLIEQNMLKSVFIKELGYEKLNLPVPCTEIYYKPYFRNQIMIPKIIAFVDLKNNYINTPELLETIKETVTMQFEGAKAENTLIVLFGEEKEKHPKIRNTIYINGTTKKLEYSIINPIYLEEKTAIANLKKETKRQEQHIEAMYGGMPRVYSYAMVLVLIMLNIFVYINHNKTNLFGISATTVLYKSQMYRLMTYMFCHSGLIHLINNMFSLLIIGRIYAKQRGTLNFLIVYLVGGIGAGIISTSWSLMTAKNINITTVGASGAIFALLGALGISAFLNGNDKTSKKRLIIYILFVVITSALNPRIDNACHVGGLITGVLVEFIIFKIEEIVQLTKYIKTKDRTKN